MALRLIARDSCDDIDGCPAVYAVNRKDVVVQGYELGTGTRDQLHLPAGENAVRLPSRLILSAAWRLILSAVRYWILSISRRLALIPRRMMGGA